MGKAAEARQVPEDPWETLERGPDSANSGESEPAAETIQVRAAWEAGLNNAMDEVALGALTPSVKQELCEIGNELLDMGTLEGESELGSRQLEIGHRLIYMATFDINE